MTALAWGIGLLLIGWFVGRYHQRHAQEWKEAREFETARLRDLSEARERFRQKNRRDA